MRHAGRGKKSEIGSQILIHNESETGKKGH